MSDIDDLDGTELLLLAMCAFLKMKRDKVLTDQELLEDILAWFTIMTMEIPVIETHQLVEQPEGIQ
jgi:hypothetical protein